MHLPEIERLANALDLGNESRYLPERQVVRLVRAPGAELIVADDPKALIGKIEKWRQVLGVAAWAAVEQQDGPVTSARAFVPDAAVPDIDVPLASTSHRGNALPRGRASLVLVLETRPWLNSRSSRYADAGFKSRPIASQYQSADSVYPVSLVDSGMNHLKCSRKITG